MVDDLLDFTADEKVLGKPVNNDLREGKLTLPVIFMLRRAGSVGEKTVSHVLADRGFERVTREELLRLAREHGALDEARALAERYAEAARKDLAVVRPLALPGGARRRSPTSSSPATTDRGRGGSHIPRACDSLTRAAVSARHHRSVHHAS